MCSRRASPRAARQPCGGTDSPTPTSVSYRGSPTANTFRMQESGSPPAAGRWHSTSHEQLTRAAVDVLARRGLINREFFDRLSEVRPQRTSEIHSVRTLWLRGAELPIATEYHDALSDLIRLLAEAFTPQQIEVVVRRLPGGDRLVLEVALYSPVPLVVARSVVGTLKQHNLLDDLCILEYIDGESLYREVSRGMLGSLAEIADLLSDVGTALPTLPDTTFIVHLMGYYPRADCG